MSSKLVESGEQIKMGTDRDFFHRTCERLASGISPSIGLELARGTHATQPIRKTGKNRSPPQFKQVIVIGIAAETNKKNPGR